MSEVKHTRGPWRTQYVPDTEMGHPDIPRWRIWSGRVPIIDGYVLADDDARLIAAAPDLHAALCRMLEMFGPGNQDTHAVRSAHAALAKAEGKETGDGE